MTDAETSEMEDIIHALKKSLHGCVIADVRDMKLALSIENLGNVVLLSVGQIVHDAKRCPGCFQLPTKL